MKRLLLIVLPLLLMVGCDKTPPTVSISSHSSGQTVKQTVTIKVTTQDNKGISRVEFFLDNSHISTDSISPYEYDWNTTQYEDLSQHNLKVISYDNSDNSTESQPILLRVDNSTSTPNGGNITSVTYTLTEMTVIWEESSDGDFKDYKVLYSDTEDGTYTSVVVITDQSITSHSITEYDPFQENWFKVKVTDYWNLTSTGNGMTNEIDSPPTQIDISSVTYDLSELVVTWKQSNDNDFVSYELLYSETQSGEQTSITTITDQTTTSHSITEFDPTQENWFKVKVTDFWGLNTTGTGMTNEIDSPPTQIDISSVTYDLSELVVTWNNQMIMILCPMSYCTLKHKVENRLPLLQSRT